MLYDAHGRLMAAGQGSRIREKLKRWLSDMPTNEVRAQKIHWFRRNINIVCPFCGCSQASVRVMGENRGMAVCRNQAEDETGCGQAFLAFDVKTQIHDSLTGLPLTDDFELPSF